MENKRNNQMQLSNMWLESNLEKVQSPAINEYTEMTNEPQKDIKRKKSKNQDKHKKSNEEDAKHRKLKKSKSKKENKSLYYEETAGISTPSKEILPELKNDITDTEYNMNSVQQNTLCEELAKNKIISMTYELRNTPHDSNKIIVSICITNIGQPLVKELIFDVPDTSSLKLVRNVS
jgi:mannitol-specific phosphotransferase system IIBC component